MSKVLYYCTHCEKSFEGEDRKPLECPACCWTSSVVREEDYREAQKARGGEPAANPGQKILGAFFFLVEALKPLLIGLLLLGGS